MVENVDEQRVDDDVEALEVEDSKHENGEKRHERDPAVELIRGDAVEELLAAPIETQDQGVERVILQRAGAGGVGLGGGLGSARGGRVGEDWRCRGGQRRGYCGGRWRWWWRGGGAGVRHVGGGGTDG